MVRLLSLELVSAGLGVIFDSIEFPVRFVLRLKWCFGTTSSSLIYVARSKRLIIGPF